MCTDDTCNGDGTCSYANNTASCDDELYCTLVDTCLGGECRGSDDPCLDNGDYCDGVEYCEEGSGTYNCPSTGDPCGTLGCEIDDTCAGSDVTLIITDAYGYSGTIDIELENGSDYVSEVHLNVCDADQRAWLHIDTSSCSTTARSSDFSCVISDLGGGCVRVDLTTVSGTIDPGTGAIAWMDYVIDVEAPTNDFADLEPVYITVEDDYDPPNSLLVTPKPGRVRAVE